MSAIAETFEPERMLADLAELDERTGGEGGARRVCWTGPWAQARAWLGDRLEELGCDVERDEAGNLWAMAGGGTSALVVGSHLDSVPHRGRLDGALGIAAALEVLRCPPAAVTVRLVDWADEEGARFGQSLFGSRCVAGALRPDSLVGVVDCDGNHIEDALAAHGVDLHRATEAARRLAGMSAYLELHIEQGPVLEEQGLSCAAVTGAFGIERHALRFSESAGHAGQTPMRRRRDAFVAAARFVVDDVSARFAAGGRAGAPPRPHDAPRVCPAGATATEAAR
jgi:N-carbamoyl-L-amino-acid hydrolase